MQTGYITSSYVPQNDEELAQGIPITTGIIKPTKPKFISDVLTIVFLQLSISTSTSVIGYHYKESLIKYVKNDPGFFYLPLILSFMSLISLSCCNLNKCAKYSMFIVFTLSMSSSITIVILPYSSAIVLQSFCVTGVSVLVINICAWISAKKNINFIGYSSFIFSMLATLLVLSLFQIFIQFIDNYSNNFNYITCSTYYSTTRFRYWYYNYNDWIYYDVCCWCSLYLFYNNHVFNSSLFGANIFK